MIQKSKIKDLVVFTDEKNSKYLNVLNDFLSYNINIIKIFRSIDDTKVMLIDSNSGKPTRVGYTFLENGTKQRTAKASGKAV